MFSAADGFVRGLWRGVQHLIGSLRKRAGSGAKPSDQEIIFGLVQIIAFQMRQLEVMEERLAGAAQTDRPCSGFLEVYSRKRAAGWAMCSDESFIPELQVFVDEVLCGSCFPDLPRLDLGRAKAAFCFEFPANLFSAAAKTARLDVRFRHNGKSIANSPAVYSIGVDDAKKVLIGLDGVLFLQADGNQVLGQLAGEVRISPAQASKWREILDKRDLKIAQRAIPVSYLIIPDKERVYAGKLPDGIKVGSELESVFRQWNSLLGPTTTARCCYPLRELVEGARLMDTYSKGDTHWNSHGAYLAYREVVNSFNASGCNILPMEVDRSMFQVAFGNADLLSKLGGLCVEEQISLPEPVFRCRVWETDQRWLTGRRIHYKSTNGSAAPYKLICFHDSFGTYLEKFLASTFSETLFIWSSEISWDQVDAFQADLILVEQVERFLISAPEF
jgi:hypothetical protein